MHGELPGLPFWRERTLSGKIRAVGEGLWRARSAFGRGAARRSMLCKIVELSITFQCHAILTQEVECKLFATLGTVDAR
jgi:hypothetical protein